MSDIELKFDIQDNSPQVLADIETAKARSLYAAGITVQKGATDSISGLYKEENKAVDTGRLRASISFITPDGTGKRNEAVANTKPTDALSGISEKDTMIFGSNVEYAAYVHNGVHRKKKDMPARPFLREGLDMSKNEIKDIITRIFKGEL